MFSVPHQWGGVCRWVGEGGGWGQYLDEIIQLLKVPAFLFKKKSLWVAEIEN